jgi:dynein heavy chain, axonemal
VLFSKLSQELGFPLFLKSNLTFSKCLEMKLQDHIESIAKVAEVAGKEYSIEQVSFSYAFVVLMLA